MDILNSLQSIGFDLRLALAHLVNFLIVVALLNYFVFGPLKQRLNERKAVQRKGVEDARAAEESRFQAKEEAAQIVQEARHKQQQVLLAAQEEAAAIKDQAQDNAQSEADAILSQAHKQIAADRERMKDQLKGQVGDLAILAAERILKREVTDQDQQRLVADVINTASHD